MSNRPSRRFLKASQIKGYLLCCICSEPFYDPVRLPCAHTFCRQCITKWSETNSSCPHCRTRYQKKKDFGKDLIAACVINDLEVACNYQGCP